MTDRDSIRRALSLSAAGLVVALAVCSSVDFIAGFIERGNAINSLRERVATPRHVESVDSLRERYKKIKKELDRAESNMLAPNPEQATAHIQRTFRELGTSPAYLDSVRMLPKVNEGNLTAIRATANLRADGERVFEIVQRLSNATPPIFLESVRVSPRPITGSARDSNAPLTDIAATVRVYFGPRTSGETPQ